MSETLIGNLALGRLGIGQSIASLSDQTNPARQIARFYDHCRKEVLRAFPWGFSLRWESLAKVADAEIPGWVYTYQYPQNCLMVRAVSDESWYRLAGLRYSCVNLWPAQIRYPWRLALKEDGEGQVILTDVDEAYAFFTADVTNTAVFPPDFVNVLAWRLAMEAGGPLQAKADLVDRAQQQYLFWHSHAAAAALNEQRDEERPDSISISCRL